jgi:hypothetical protein
MDTSTTLSTGFGEGDALVALVHVLTLVDHLHVGDELFPFGFAQDKDQVTQLGNRARLTMTAPAMMRSAISKVRRLASRIELSLTEFGITSIIQSRKR